MKTLFFALFLAFTSAMIAQEAQENKVNNLEILKKELTLTDAQVEQIKALHKDAKAKRMENRTMFASDKQAMQTANKTLKAASQAKMKTILTAEQFVKFEDFKEKKQEEKQTEKLTKLTTSLALTDAQKSKVLQATTERDEKIKSNKETIKDIVKLAEANKQTRQEFRTKLKSFLSAEQVAKWKELKDQNKSTEVKKP